jgi:hypothetical protein
LGYSPNQGGLQLALLIQLENGWPFWLTQVAPLKAMPTCTLLEFATVTLEARPNGVGAPKTMFILNRLIYTYF